MEELKKFREVNHLTQDQLGEYLGIKKSFISRVENGQVGLPADKFFKLVKNDRGWDASALKNIMETTAPFHVYNFMNPAHVEALRFRIAEAQGVPTVSKPRMNRESKNEKLYEENLMLKKRLDELEKRIEDLDKQNKEYWELIKKLSDK